MSTARFIVGDSLTVLRTLPDASVDLVLSSPPFLALRSYLPADHPDKAQEIGGEPNPGEFVDTLLTIANECRRVLAPHGSLCFELGDTYSGSGGAGGDYNALGMRAEQPAFRQSRAGRDDGAWPLAKSLCLIPELFRIGLVYGVNPLTGTTWPRWRARNVVRWVRPNPPVGALGDKFRPATSEMVVACTSGSRYFDLDAVRGPYSPNTNARTAKGTDEKARSGKSADRDGNWSSLPERDNDGAGAPPLDWWAIPTAPYKGRVTTSRRVPCGPHDDGERTTSPDCPVHAGLPGQLPKGLRDERADGSPNHTSHSNGRPAHERLSGFASSDASLDRSGSTPVPTSPSSPPQGSPAASPRGTGSSRTGPAPETSSPGTASGRSPAGTDDTSGSLPSAAPRPDMPESSTSSGDSDASPLHRSDDDTARTPRPVAACSCSFHRSITETTSHYAAFPEELCVRPIAAMCPQRVCTTCGEPSRRIVDAERSTDGNFDRGHAVAKSESNGRTFASNGATARTTTGWTDCGHGGTWRTGVVLDPFAGSGTTLAVATGHGRDAIGIDLDSRNALLAADRVGMFLTVEQPEAAA